MTLDENLHERLSRYLPDDLLRDLPDPQALTAVIRRLNSLRQAISSFLPLYIADNEELHTQDYADLRSGTFLFADVSGFTALSEKLQRADPRDGPNILTEAINDFFATMLEILAKSNGVLLKFAGDALLTFFPAPHGEDETPLAIRTGLRMQRAMKEQFQPIRHEALTGIFGEHDIELTMSIGICRGQLFEALVGNNDQRDHIIQGDLPGQAMAAEGAGERDDVIITAKLQETYGDQFDTVPVGDGFYQVVDNFGDNLSDYEFVVPRRRRGQASALFDLTEQNLLRDVQDNLERLDNVARFVSREVVNKLAFQGGHIEPENRPATVIFLHFTGFAELLQQWGEQQLPLLTSLLARYYNLMQRTIASNGGSLNRTDPYQRGGKMLITFGAPIAHLDDPERAVTTALEMNRQLDLFNARLRDELPDELRRDTFITQRIGITHGWVFAGEAGWKSRREYTVMGDDVNLAARLMSKGEMGQILIDEDMWERVRAHFETEALEPFLLKGKSEPTHAYLVKASTISPLSMSATSGTPFVGRDLQLLSMTYALQQVKGPRRCQAFALQGDVGVGKTRMAKQIVEAAENAGFRVAWANCQLRHSQDQDIWAAIVFQLLQLDQAKSECAQRRLLHVRLQEWGMAELESIFSVAIFGSYERVEPDKPAADTPAPKPEPEPPPPARSTPKTNIFQLAQASTDLGRSGIFGMARDQLEALRSSQPGTLWQSIQDQVSISESVVRFLRTFTGEVPTLLVIDDLHLGDPAALEILTRVLDEITRSRLMVVVTTETTGDLDLNIRRKVSVGDLDEDETIMLATRALKVSEIGPELGRLLWERTSGRPLFIESLLHMLDSDGYIDRTNEQAELNTDMEIDALPDDVRTLIVSQTDRLSPDARAALQVASVLGDGFPADALGTIGEIEDEIRLAAILEEMIQVRIIEMLPDHTYRFQHGLTQATVYGGLNRLQRLNLHRAAAEYWQQQPDPDRYVHTIAYHLVKAGMPTRAMELIVNKADQAEQDQQIDRAIELYTHALSIFPHDNNIREQLVRLQHMQAGQ